MSRTIASASVQAVGPAWRQDIHTSGDHRLTADEPESAGGANAGPAPYALYLAALGACTTMTLQMYAARKGWDLGSLRVDLTLEKDDEGRRRIARRIHADGALDAAQWGRLLEIAERTPVTLSVREGLAIDTRRGEPAT